MPKCMVDPEFGEQRFARSAVAGNSGAIVAVATGEGLAIVLATYADC